VEWNLRLSRQRRPHAYAELVEAFEALWTQATPITPVWLADYRERVQKNNVALPPGETAPDPPEAPVQHRQTQLEALEALATSRLNGHRRALVVMATGLGKTFLAAFDVQAFSETLGRTPRVLIHGPHFHFAGLCWQRLGDGLNLCGEVSRSP
jgi:predicted helicase